MERSISSLTFKGSVPEAILEAKRQKKLFVVYISGEDDLSANLESSTLTDARVAESLSKYCIFLHIPEGSPAAVNFSAIYPQKSVPCITAVGYNGVQLWQSDVSSSSRDLSAEDLASSLEKAWLSLHIQETTATFLTAALASKQSESSFGTSNLPSTEQGSSSSIVSQSASTDKNAQSSKNEQSVASEIVEEKNSIEHAAKEKVEEFGDMISSESSTSKAVNMDNKRPYPSTEPAKEPVKSPRVNPEKSSAAHFSSNTNNGNLIEEKKVDHHSDVPKRGSPLITNGTNKSEGKKAVTEDRSVDTADECQKVNRSSDVHLNIRLPDGASLRETFSVTDTLRMVKEYVDKNQQSSFGKYDLAIPYPRKLFTDQELGRTLLDLDLLDRQALIVVPRQASYTGGSLSFHKTDSTPNSNSSDGNIGYFSVIGKVLSFFNPFSYLGNGASSSSSGQESQNGTWQYRPNPALRTNLAGTPYSPRSPFSARLPNQQTSESSNNDSTSKKPTTANRPFGSNIHTLKHDEEDDKRFDDGNKFWNGNSTQYGGGSNDKK